MTISLFAAVLLPKSSVVVVADVYANAFQVEPSRCFRFVTLDEARGQPIRCPGEIVTRGRWRDGAAKLRLVEACADHAADIEDLLSL